MSIFKPIDTSDHPIKLLFPGVSGTGKTTKAAQLRSGKARAAVFNFDNNTSSLQLLPKEDRDYIDIIDPRLTKDGKEYDIKNFWSNFMDLLAIVAASKDHSTIIIDSTTTLVDELYWSLIGQKNPKLRPGGPDGKNTFQFWGDIRSHLNVFSQHFLHAPDLDKHVIVIAHDAKEKDEITGTTSTQIILPGSSQATFPLHFTDIWRCYAKVNVSGKVEYRVRTAPEVGVVNKKSLPVPDDFIWEVEKSKIQPFFKNISK